MHFRTTQFYYDVAPTALVCTGLFCLVFYYDVAPTALFSTIDKDVTESKLRRMSIGIFEMRPASPVPCILRVDGRRNKNCGKRLKALSFHAYVASAERYSAINDARQAQRLPFRKA
ncbi:MAG TPA: hypothetical protein PLO56_07790 [Rhodothermales bacterium]|nr:hypothetical protein [Rhodothermales bacterium]